jgi:OMF family outer membrane factor
VATIRRAIRRGWHGVWGISALISALAAQPVSGDDSAAVSVPLPPVDLRLIEEGKRMPIDLGSAVRLAVADNLEIREARARIDEATGEKNRALGGLVPKATVSFAAGETDGLIQGSFGDLEEHTFGTINPAGRITFAVDPGAALFDALARYRGLDATVQRADAVTQDILLAVAIAYFDLEQAQARVAIAEQAVAESTEFVRVSDDRERLGSGLQVDVRRAEAQLAADQGLLTLRQKEFRDASVRLALVTQLDPALTLFPLETAVAPRHFIAAAELRTLIDRAAAERPELKEVANRAQAAEDQRDAAWWKALGPKVGGFVEESAIGTSFGNLGNRQIYGGVIGWEFALTTAGDIQAAQARREQAVIQVARARDVVTAEVVRAHEGFRAAAEQIDIARRGVEAAEAALVLSQSRYAGGVGLALDVLEAERALTTACTGLVAAIQAYNGAQAQLLRATGELSAEVLITGG